LTGVDEVHSAWHCAIDARMASDYLRVFDGRLEFSEGKVIMHEARYLQGFPAEFER